MRYPVVVSQGSIRTFVTLSSSVSVEDWADRHSLGEVPDATPYGLHRLANYDIAVQFRSQTFGKVASRISRGFRHRTGGLEMFESLTDFRLQSRASTDVVLAYDERTGVPAALLGRRPNAAAVVTGIGWLTTRESANPALRRIARTALPRAAAVWAQCEPMLGILQRDWAIPASRLNYVPLGIDADFYAVQPPPERPGVIASAGEDRFRDHQLLIDAVSEVRRNKSHVTLELATSLPVKLPGEWGVLHTERLYGAMRSVYQRASVVAVALLPTITGSGLSVILEAMASARPVVVTDNPGLSRYVQHGETGILVPAGDTAKFARALDELLGDPAYAQEMGLKAAKAVREMFTSEVMARHLAENIRGV